jgi:hypothetical protein
LSFSAYTNIIKIFKIEKNEGQLECLHGIRFFSMAWVVLGHTYAFSSAITGKTKKEKYPLKLS